MNLIIHLATFVYLYNQADILKYRTLAFYLDLNLCYNEFLKHYPNKTFYLL
jgi:hypothetical protein